MIKFHVNFVLAEIFIPRILCTLPCDMMNVFTCTVVTVHFSVLWLHFSSYILMEKQNNGWNNIKKHLKFLHTKCAQNLLFAIRYNNYWGLTEA